MVADVDALQDLYLRGLGPPLVALLAGAVSVAVAAVLLPVAGLVLAAGLLAGGLAVPALSGALATSGRRRQATARGELSAELVELPRRAPELVAYGGEGPRLDRLRAADRALVKLARRDAFATGAGEAVRAVGRRPHGRRRLGLAAVDASAGPALTVLIAMLALLALASFEAVTPLGGRGPRALGHARRRPTGARADARRMPTVRDPANPAPAPAWPFGPRLRGRPRPLPRRASRSRSTA